MKLPEIPYSSDAERSIIGSLILDPKSFELVEDLIYSGDFYDDANGKIFEAIKQLHDSGVSVDVLTVEEKLNQNKTYVKDSVYLLKILNQTPSSANIKSYVRIVKARSIYRSLINAASEISEIATSSLDDDVIEVLDRAESKIFSIANSGSSKENTIIPISSVLNKAIDRIDELYETGEAFTGISTGYLDIDNMTSGLQKSDLIIIAGRPSAGKTALSINIAENVAIQTRLPVLIFSMEMPAESLGMRMLSSLGRIDQGVVRSGKLANEEWPRLASVTATLAETKLFIDDSPSLTPAEIRSRSRRFVKEQGGIGLIVIDYLQLMQVPGYKNNRVAEVSEISRSLKALAKELNVPVIALSQLNRSLEARQNKRPVMSDLRDSGAVEQDADLIMFIYRDEVYDPSSPDKGTAEVIIGKQRNGPIGTIRLAFLGKYTRFETLSRELQNDNHL